MKKSAQFLVLVIGIVMTTASSAGSLEITNDASACIDGWLTMDVTVKTNGESFKFAPACNFKFSDDFETRAGVKCEINAGMCSGFWPNGLFEVDCDDGSFARIGILCPSAF